jgi:hypothetical protein
MTANRPEAFGGPVSAFGETVMQIKGLGTGAAALCALLVAGCGGGGGSAAPATGSAVVSTGVVTGFGSVYVNGVRYDTSSAAFTIDDSPGSQADLAVGDVVTVRGRVSDDGRSGTASSVAAEDAVEGPVSASDPVAGTLVVAGQTVITDADTSYDDNIPGAELAGLVVGDFVEVAGFLDADGAVRATRIEKKPAGSTVEVNGVISQLDAANSRFHINGLEISYASAVLEDFDGAQPANGDFVEAKGTTFVAGVLQATKVEKKGPGGADDDDSQHEVEGLITRFQSATDFDVAGRPVTTTGSTIYENGSAGDLGLNLKVEVEGTANAEGVLVARKVSIRRASYLRLTALVDSVDAAAGTLVVLGVTVQVDALTRLEDKSDADDESFSLADIRVGDYVEVRGGEFPAASGRLLARRLEREDAESRSIVQGPVSAVANPNLTIFGITVATDSGTEFEDLADNSLSASAFFAQVATGDLVKVRGPVVGDQLIAADEVEFEDEDD